MPVGVSGGIMGAGAGAGAALFFGAALRFAAGRFFAAFFLAGAFFVLRAAFFALRAGAFLLALRAGLFAFLAFFAFFFAAMMSVSIITGLEPLAGCGRAAPSQRCMRKTLRAFLRARESDHRIGENFLLSVCW
jgi:hypothetical protein